jgi:hypothetical protein
VGLAQFSRGVRNHAARVEKEGLEPAAAGASEEAEFQRADRDEGADRRQEQQPRAGPGVEFGEQQPGGHALRQLASASLAKNSDEAGWDGFACVREWELHE